MNALSQFQKCQTHSDDRVVSLVLRLVGIMVKNDSSLKVFSLIQSGFPSLLETLTNALTCDSDALKFGGVEALSGILASPVGVDWFLNHSPTDLIVNIFRSNNLFVVQSCCRLICIIIESANRDEPCLKELYSSLISSQFIECLNKMMHRDALSDSKMTALELVWMVSNSSNTQFLHHASMVRIYLM